MKVDLEVHRALERNYAKSPYLARQLSPPIACYGGTRSSMFGLQRMQNSTVNTRDSRFILVRALDRDRVIALCPVGVSLCVGLIVKSCVVQLLFELPIQGALPSFI